MEPPRCLFGYGVCPGRTCGFYCPDCKPNIDPKTTMTTGDQEKGPMERPCCLFCDTLLRRGDFGWYCPLCEPHADPNAPRPDDDDDDDG